MSLNQHEIDYSPSHWSKRLNSIELFTHFLKASINVTKKARVETKCLLDVPYGLTDRTKYDIYGTDLPKDAPIYVFIHGGYWQESSKDYAGFPVPVLVPNGIKVIIIGYDLCPNVKLEEIISQMKLAVEQILNSALESGCRCVWITGHSAGAHLAASVLYDRTWIERMTQKRLFQLLKCVMLISGVYNLEPISTTLYNKALQLTENEIKTLSFSTIETKDYDPIPNLKVIITVGECDSPVFVNETREYAQKLLSVVDNVQYILLRDNIDHFDIVEKLLDSEFLLTRLILESMCGK